VQEGVNKLGVEKFFVIIIESFTKFCTNNKIDPHVLGYCHQCENITPLKKEEEESKVYLCQGFLVVDYRTHKGMFFY